VSSAAGSEAETQLKSNFAHRNFMRSGGNYFNYFHENQVTKLAHLLQFKRVLMSCLGDWGGPRVATPLQRKMRITLSRRFVFFSKCRFIHHGRRRKRGEETAAPASLSLSKYLKQANLRLPLNAQKPSASASGGLSLPDLITPRTGARHVFLMHTKSE